jgi:hypothetical protein
MLTATGGTAEIVFHREGLSKNFLKDFRTLIKREIAKVTRVMNVHECNRDVP